MSTETLNKNNLDTVLRELAKEYRRLAGKKAYAEIVLVGGAAVICNYSFRDMTTDVDAIIAASSVIKEASSIVASRFNLPRDWLNDDFRKTASFSPQLRELSEWYKTFYGILEVRVISAEYLIAMKLRSGRKYKNDLSDIAGILMSHKKLGAPITYNQVTVAVEKLYGSWDAIPAESADFLKNLLNSENYDEVYTAIRSNERQAKQLIIDFTENYPGVMNQSNAHDIIRTLMDKKAKENQK